MFIAWIAFEHVGCAVRAEHEPAVGVLADVLDDERMVDGVKDVFVGNAVLARRPMGSSRRIMYYENPASLLLLRCRFAAIRSGLGTCRLRVPGSLLFMRTFHLDPGTRERVSLVLEEIERLLGEGKHIAVTVAEEQERGERARDMADEFSRSLDALGAPLE